MDRMAGSLNGLEKIPESIVELKEESGDENFEKSKKLDKERGILTKRNKLCKTLAIYYCMMCHVSKLSCERLPI